jgi:hypothetical protein
MLVRVDQPGRHDAAFGVDDFKLDAERFNGLTVDLADFQSLSFGQEHRAFTNRPGSVYFAVFNQGQHFICSFGQ